MTRGLPFVIVDGVPVLAGVDEDGTLFGITVPDGETASFTPDEVVGVVSIDPAAVYFGASFQIAAESMKRAAAPKMRGRPPHYQPRGHLFHPLPEGMVTGYAAARPVLERFRSEPPDVLAIRYSALFAVSTIRVTIEQAEKSFECFVRVADAEKKRAFPTIKSIRDCFAALRNVKARQFLGVAEYAPTIRTAMERGLRDRELRRYLAQETDLPLGLGLTKLSFTLLLLGQDCMCMDSRILQRMFGSPEAADKVMASWGKTPKGRISDLGIARYEAVEESFLTGNRFYDPHDPIGRGAAQWISWEPLAQPPKPAPHTVWLKVAKRYEGEAR